MPSSRSNPKLFLDTSVIIAALMSPTGGARLLFHLGESNILCLTVGRSVMQEAEAVISRKAPHLLVDLAQLLDETRVDIGENPSDENISTANQLVDYSPDVLVLAEALQVRPDWFITHDREHFLNNSKLQSLSFRIGTPGNVLVWLREQL